MMESKPVAVLVDCDNASPRAIDLAMNIAKNLGRVAVRRGYGGPPAFHGKWLNVLSEYGFTPMLQNQLVSGKNSADISLAVEAIELALERKIRLFVIVTSDSDFSFLCRRLMEKDCFVAVLGDHRSSMGLIKSCDQFWLFDGADDIRVSESSFISSLSELHSLILKTYEEVVDEGGGNCISLSDFGSRLRLKFPGFSCKKWGFKSLTKLLTSIDSMNLSLKDGVICVFRCDK